jgi:mono/diheme cytochrome c family protein
MWTKQLALIVLLAGCRNDWRTDMWYQQSHRAQSAPRPAPPESVSLFAPPPLVDLDDAEELKNPIAPSPPSLAHGRWLFGERCACCHGAAGHGGGPVSKFFPPAPDLSYVTIRQRSDGRLFGSITLGGRAMPPAAEGLTNEDRWDLVNYVRALQRGAQGSP